MSNGVGVRAAAFLRPPHWRNSVVRVLIPEIRVCGSRLTVPSLRTTSGAPRTQCGENDATTRERGRQNVSGDNDASSREDGRQKNARDNDASSRERGSENVAPQNSD